MWSDGPVQFNAESGTVEQRLAMPEFMRSGGHPSLSPGGDLFVTDRRISGSKSDWGVALGSFASNEWHLLKKFDNSQGATSWRRNHPHPIFSRDGKRIYFNVNSDQWTRLYVAEVGLISAHGSLERRKKN